MGTLSVSRIVPFPEVPVDGIRTRHALMIQGPFGPFFRRLATQLEAVGLRVTKVHLSGADLWDWGPRAGALMFRGAPDGWAQWLRSLIGERAVTDLIVYGDCQSYHREAIAVARGCDVRVHVLEQGYFRPHWITIEPDGVNGFSPRMGRPFGRHGSRGRGGPDTMEPSVHRTSSAGDVSALPLASPGAIRRASVRHALLANLALVLSTPLFAEYQSPFPLSLWAQATGSARRYLTLRWTRRERLARIASWTGNTDPYFLVLLQRPGDSQLTVHSSFPSVAALIRRAIGSFAAHAPEGARLLFKCHPLDPGLQDHAGLIAQLALSRGVGERVAYADGGVLRDLLAGAQGAVTVNSTAGLTALEMGCPLITLGRALYDLPGLTWQGGLDRFWSEASAPDPVLFADFRRRLIAETQVAGDYWTARGMALAAPVAARIILAAGARDGAAEQTPDSAQGAAGPQAA